MTGDITAEEARWIKRLQKVLRECPSDRLGFYTIGDPSIEIYDKRFDQEIGDIQASGDIDFCQAVERLDVHIGRVVFPSNVQSTVG